MLKMAQAPTEYGNDGPKSEVEITDCPICFEHFRNPKSLPCLHTFCQECLNHFIIASLPSQTTEVPNTFFVCPICRQETRPKIPSSSPSEWASHFPTNHFVLEMLESKRMDEDITQFCHSCSNNGCERVAASFWCRDCRNCFCSSCQVNHEGHHVVHSTTRLTQQTSAKVRCEKHGKTLKLFCVDHRCFGCRVCVAMEHNKCENVTTVTEYADNIRDQLSGIQEEADVFVEDINVLMMKSQDKLDDLNKDKDSALEALEEVQSWFKFQQSKLAEQVMTIYKEESERERGIFDRMELVRKDLLKTKELTDDTRQDNAIISSFIEAKSKLSRYSDFAINSTDTKQNTKIVLQFDDFFQKLKSSDIGIGKVLAVKSCDPSTNLQQKSFVSRTGSMTKTNTLVTNAQTIEKQNCISTQSTVGPQTETFTIQSTVGPLVETSAFHSNVGPLIETSITPSTVGPLIETSTTPSTVGPLIETSITPSTVGPLIETSITPSTVGPLVESSTIQSSDEPMTETSTNESTFAPLIEGNTSLVQPACRPMFDRSVVKIGFISVRRGNSIRGMLALSSGNVILTNCEHKELLYVSEAGDTLDTLTLEDRPWDLCQMSGEEVGVSLYRKKRITIVRLSSSDITLVRDIQLQESPWGIAYFNGSLFVSSLTLYKVSEDGQLQKVKTLPSNSYHLCSEGRGIVGSLVQSSSSRPALYRVSRNHKYSEVAKVRVIKKPYGVDTDADGNLYVCGYESNNVVQISADGSKTRKLIEEVSQPYQISICGDKLYLNKFNNNIIHIYKLE